MVNPKGQVIAVTTLCPFSSRRITVGIAEIPTTYVPHTSRVSYVYLSSLAPCSTVQARGGSNLDEGQCKSSSHICQIVLLVFNCSFTVLCRYRSTSRRLLSAMRNLESLRTTIYHTLHRRPLSKTLQISISNRYSIYPAERGVFSVSI